MRRLRLHILTIIMISMLLNTAIADTVFSGMSFDELVEMQRELTTAIWASDMWEEVTVPVGVYEVGVDIPAGKWTISGTDNLSGIVYWGESLDQFGVNIESEIADFTHWKDESISWNLVDGTYISVTINPVVFTPYTPTTLGFGAKKKEQEESSAIGIDDLQEKNIELEEQISELQEKNATLEKQIKELKEQLNSNIGNEEPEPTLGIKETPAPVDQKEAYRNLKKGDYGDDVKRLNQKLSDLGYLTGNVNNIYGTTTKETVELFQQMYNLPVTGEVDIRTQKALFTATVTLSPNLKSTPATTSYSLLEKGDKGDRVKKLQARLIELGYLSGNADGDYGNMTESAVMAFQQAIGLSKTGKADSNTQKELFSSNAPKAKVYAKLDYTAIARDPDAYKGDLITFQGKILQVMEYGNSIVFRISSKGSYDNVMYCTYTAPNNYSRFLEDDKVIVYGECTGIYTYETIMGASVTIPSCRIDRIELQ